MTPSVALGLGGDETRHRGKRQHIAMATEAADDAMCGGAHVRCVAKRFSAVNIRQMYLDHRQLRRLERVEDSDRSVCVGAGVEDNAVGILTSLLDPVDQLAFVVGLAEIDRQA